MCLGGFLLLIVLSPSPPLSVWSVLEVGYLGILVVIVTVYHRSMVTVSPLTASNVACSFRTKWKRDEEYGGELDDDGSGIVPAGQKLIAVSRVLPVLVLALDLDLNLVLPCLPNDLEAILRGRNLQELADHGHP